MLVNNQSKIIAFRGLLRIVNNTFGHLIILSCLLYFIPVLFSGNAFDGFTSSFKKSIGSSQFVFEQLLCLNRYCIVQGVQSLLNLCTLSLNSFFVYLILIKQGWSYSLLVIPTLSCCSLVHRGKNLIQIAVSLLCCACYNLTQILIGEITIHANGIHSCSPFIAGSRQFAVEIFMAISVVYFYLSNVTGRLLLTEVIYLRLKRSEFSFINACLISASIYTVLVVFVYG